MSDIQIIPACTEHKVREHQIALQLGDGFAHIKIKICFICGAVFDLYEHNIEYEDYDDDE